MKLQLPGVLDLTTPSSILMIIKKHDQHQQTFTIQKQHQDSRSWSSAGYTMIIPPISWYGYLLLSHDPWLPPPLNQLQTSASYPDTPSPTRLCQHSNSIWSFLSQQPQHWLPPPPSSICSHSMNSSKEATHSHTHHPFHTTTTHRICQQFTWCLAIIVATAAALLPHPPLPQLQLQLQLQPSSSFSSNDTHLQPRTFSQSCHSLYIPTSLPAVLILSFFHAFASLVGNVSDMSANVSDMECLWSLARQRTSKVGATCDVTNVTTWACRRAILFYLPYLGFLCT